MLAASVLAAMMIFPISAEADEGMWLVNAIDKALEKNMKARGLKLSAKEIYNADAEGATLSDAIVSLEFGCTGSMISKDGLMITNHHCAYADVYNLSMRDGSENYLENGFWALQSKEEVNIPGKTVFFLKKIIDVTEDVKKVKAEEAAKGHHIGSRKLSMVMERKFAEEGLETMFYSMWRGSVYYMAYYQVYKDVRLVAAPPTSISAFGGDIDNWEWPQHKCDFAMYRIYTAPDGSPAEYSEDNVPLHPEKVLKISTKGIKEGDFTMILGYPGRTERYCSSAELRFNEHIELPIRNKLRAQQMKIIKDWMAKDEKLKLLYSDYYFGLSNFQELGEGEQKCFGRFCCVKRKSAIEYNLQKWIDADPERKAKWGNLLSELERGYALTADIERNINYYRETMVRGMYFSRIIMRAGNSKDFKYLHHVLDHEAGNYDLRVEKDLFNYIVEQYRANIDSRFLTEYQKEMFAKYSNRELADYLWNNSILISPDLLAKVEAENAGKGNDREVIQNDPLIKFCYETKITDFKAAKDELEDVPDLLELGREYAKALYQMRLEQGTPQYPDANSSMRITYGRVGGISPYDGVYYSWQSTASGILEKYDPDSFDYKLDDKQRNLLEKNRKMPINFLTDNDITGGNSGSPVLNGKGELVGLAFDGNKESLASNADYVNDYNKTVCVDIRYILWVLDKYASMDRILDELHVR